MEEEVLDICSLVEHHTPRAGRVVHMQPDQET